MIYLFDIREFQVLAAAKGVMKYYGYSSDIELKKEDIYFAVYQMAKSGLLKPRDGELVLQQPVSVYMQCICNSPGVLVIDRGRYQLPSQCIYCCNGLVVCLENSFAEPETLCLSGLKNEEWIQQLSDLNQLPEEQLQEDLGSFDYLGYWKSSIRADLWELLQQSIQTETEVLVVCEQLYSAFSTRNKDTGELYARMLIVALPLEYCIVLQKRDQENRYELYKKEYAIAQLKRWEDECVDIS
ncbi:MAG: hypothetical protein ACRDBO_11665 [Lachnospiraceae bacterium]